MLVASICASGYAWNRWHRLLATFLGIMMVKAHLVYDLLRKESFSGPKEIDLAEFQLKLSKP